VTSSRSSSGRTLPSSSPAKVLSVKKKRIWIIHQPNPPKGIDKRTLTRYATPEERKLAGRALMDLAENFQRVILVPAPRQSFDGHMIRTVEIRNPKWYSKFVEARNYQVKRCRVLRALTRVYERGRVRWNGYDGRLLKALAEAWEN
jgi:hypothetical protein